MSVSKNRRRKKNENRRKNKKMKKKAAFMNKSVQEVKHEEMKTYKYVPPKTVSKVPVLQIEKKERDDAIKLMRSIFEVQSTSGSQYDMIQFILEFIKSQPEQDAIKWDMDDDYNIYVTKGSAETYPCIVAHMDTVHNMIPQKDYKVLNSDTEFFAINMATRSQTGIGGDDNNGIYCALDNFIREPNIKIAFFVDEEIGCVGSAASDTSFFDDCSFVLQADRKGYNDVANEIMYTTMFGDEFLTKIVDTLDKYNRELVDGGMTDVMQLAHNGVDCAMANFSCGYYMPHSDYEYVVIDELILTSILFRDIIKVSYIDGERNIVDRIVPDYNTYGGWGYDYHDYGSGGKAKTQITEGDGKSDYYSELESDDDLTMSSQKRLHSGSIDPVSHSKDCSYCGQPTMWDESMQMGFCNNCMDYDYNSANRH